MKGLKALETCMGREVGERQCWWAVRLVQLAAAWVWCLRWLRRTRLQVRQSCCFYTCLPQK